MEGDGRGGSDRPRPERPRARGGAAALGGRGSGESGSGQREWAEPGSEERIACPFCGSEDTERIGLWGATLLASQYWCHACRTGFDVVRWRPRPAETGSRAAGAAAGRGAVATGGPQGGAPGQ